MSYMPTIFLDLDGVMADFDKTFPEKFLLSHIGMDKKKMWEHIHSVPDFFVNLPLMPGAMWLYDTISYRFGQPFILTACPASRYHDVAKQKRQWVRNHLGSAIVLPSYGSEGKPAFMHNPGDILIDDWGKNCDAWEAAGGVAIKHENARDTMAKLEAAIEAHFNE